MSLRRDWIWFVAIPFYLVVGTFRHEACHAVVAMWEGARIEWFHVWPRLSPKGVIEPLGYVIYDRSTTWVTCAAPYIGDLIVFVLFFIICLRAPLSNRSLWLNLVILGMISPLLNSAFNYSGALGGGIDVSFLLTKLPRAVVHTYFILTLLLYAAGVLIVSSRYEAARLLKTKRRGSGPLAETTVSLIDNPAPSSHPRAHLDVVIATALGLVGILGEPIVVAAGIQPTRAAIRVYSTALGCPRALAEYKERRASEIEENRWVTALSDIRQTAGEGQRVTLDCALALADYFRRSKSCGDAERLFSETVESIRQHRGGDLSRFQTAKFGLAASLYCKREFESAAGMCRELAIGGHSGGQRCMGILHEHGHGVPRDLEKAVNWYTKAAKQGDKGSQDRLEELDR